MSVVACNHHTYIKAERKQHYYAMQHTSRYMPTHIRTTTYTLMYAHTYTHYHIQPQNDKNGLGKMAIKEVLSVVVSHVQSWGKKEDEQMCLCKALDADKDGMLELAEVCTILVFVCMYTSTSICKVECLSWLRYALFLSLFACIQVRVYVR
jgi:hypothetical protein